MVDEDPNADLIGYEMDTDLGRMRVIGTNAASGTPYVDVETIDNPLVIRMSVKPAGLVRAHKLHA